MKHVMTPERVEVVLRSAKEGGTRIDLQNALGISNGAARVLLEQCIRENLVTTIRAGQHQPAKLVLKKRWSPDQEDEDEQKKPTGKNWFEGWAGAPVLGLGKA